jgi:hypothetical protein
MPTVLNFIFYNLQNKKTELHVPVLTFSEYVSRVHLVLTMGLVMS